MCLVVRNIPKDNAKSVRLALGGGKLRGRGKRVHNGKRYFQDLPPNLSERFSLYCGSYHYPHTQTDFLRIDNGGKIRLRMVGGQ